MVIVSKRKISIATLGFVCASIGLHAAVSSATLDGSVLMRPIKLDVPQIDLRSMSGSVDAPDIILGQQVALKRALNTWAITHGYGFKTANLLQLDALIKDLKRLPHGYNVQVPTFIGVSAQQVSVVLKKHGMDLAARWDDLLETSVTLADRAAKNLSPEFLVGCEKLAAEVNAQFEAFATRVAAGATLGSLGFDEKTAGQITKLIRDVAVVRGFITTRSTGLREDTETVANAGGNESKEIVHADIASVLRAMGKVASSYLKTKSLQQRAEAKDEQLFDRPALPVLVQRVVGEHEGNPVVSCVSYTQEAQGRTEGLSMSQCNYGHGKAVVESLYPMDTYIMGDSAHFTVIKVKNKRLAPQAVAGKFGLHEVDNSEDIQAVPALDSQTQQALHALLMQVERYYGRSMDLELVIDKAKKVIYLVQARPVLHRKVIIEPRYLADISTVTEKESIRCTKVNEADGTVHMISDKKLVLVQETLDDALNTVLAAQRAKNDATTIIVVKRGADITSHAGATLRGMGKVILETTRASELETWLKQERLALIVDTQRGVIINNVAGTSFAVKMGRFNHPVPAKMTVDPESKEEKVERASTGATGAYHERASMHDLVEMIKEAPQEQAQQALESVLARLAEEIEQHKTQVLCEDEFFDCREESDTDLCKIQTMLDGVCFKGQSAETAVKKLTQIFSHALFVAKQLQKTLTLAPRSALRLFMTSRLEALLFQEDAPVVVDDYSLTSTREAYGKEVAFIKNTVVPLIVRREISGALLSNRPLLLLAQDGVEAALTPELEKSWVRFVAGIAQSATVEQRAQFESMVTVIMQLGAFPQWLHFIFEHEYELEKDITRLHAKLQEIFSASATTLRVLQDKKAMLSSMNLAVWDDPKKFASALKSFMGQMSYFMSEEFLSLFAPGNEQELARIAALPLMLEVVEKYDHAIKILKSSRLYVSEAEKIEQVGNFKTMLGLYFTLLEKLVAVIPEGIIPCYKLTPVDKHIAQLRDILTALPSTPDQLYPSAGFNVVAAAIGSGAHFNYKGLAPKTAEDLFTTVHQSLNNIIGALYKSMSIIDRFTLPDMHRGLHQELIRSSSLVLAGGFFEGNQLSLVHNIKLREHSIVLISAYDKKRDRLLLTMKFCGGNEYERWDYIIFMARIFALAYDFDIDDIEVQKMGASFRFIIKQLPAGGDISAMVNSFADLSFYWEYDDDNNEFSSRFISKKMQQALQKNAQATQHYANIFFREFVGHTIAHLMSMVSADVSYDIVRVLKGMDIRPYLDMHLWIEVFYELSRLGIPIFSLLYLTGKIASPKNLH